MAAEMARIEAWRKRLLFESVVACWQLALQATGSIKHEIYSYPSKMARENDYRKYIGSGDRAAAHCGYETLMRLATAAGGDVTVKPARPA